MTKTAAERQKHYRDSKRNAPVTENVTRVTVKPERNALAEVSDNDLQLRLKSYPDDTWTDSPEYQEVLRRRPTVHVFPESGMAFDKDRLEMHSPQVRIALAGP